MVTEEVLRIAAKNGWSASVSEEPGKVSFDFRRKTLGGVPFCFTAEAGYGNMKHLISEIVSFVDAIEPERCAMEWMIKSGAMATSRYRQAVTDMENIRTEAWLLTCELDEFSGYGNFLCSFPWNGSC